MESLIAELSSWLDENWNPDLTVGEWWERLGLAGWSAPNLPEHAYGRGLSARDTAQVADAIARHGALGAPGGLGLMLAAPTIATFGVPEQIDRYVREIVTGQKAWCQLFSEPVAGSDLAGLQTRAVRDGNEFVVNGQKVWTSSAHDADFGMLIARTDSELPKHQGISYFALDMHQPGIEVRPLREMTGRSLFTEVFMTDARASAASIIGELNGGWRVANATLGFERAGLGVGGGHAAASPALPGSVAGHLERRAGDFSPAALRGRGGGGGGLVRNIHRLLTELARANGAISDPTIRHDLVRLRMLGEIGRMASLRQRGERARGRDVPGFGNLAKLAMSDTMRLQRDLGLRILGPGGMLHAYRSDARSQLEAVTGSSDGWFVTEMALWAQGPPIYGGTDQVQRNIIAERVLGLPREPGFDRETPFSAFSRNT